MSLRRHLILSAVCIASLSAGPALAAQGQNKADGRPSHAQKNKPSKEDKARGKQKKDRDRERSDDDRGRRSDEGTMRFRGLDRNNDGVITRAEWRGNDRSFANHDWNRDGVLSGDEVRPGATRPGNRRY